MGWFERIRDCGVLEMGQREALLRDGFVVLRGGGFGGEDERIECGLRCSDVGG